MDCKLNGEIVEPCTGLESVLESHHNKGISMLPIHGGPNKRFETVKTFVIIKNGEHRKNGLVCRYCPFCGQEIYKGE